MENRQALKLIEKIQKELFKDNFEVSEIVTDLKKLREITLELNNPVVTKALRLAYEHLENNNGVFIGIPDDEPVDSKDAQVEANISEARNHCGILREYSSYPRQFASVSSSFSHCVSFLSYLHHQQSFSHLPPIVYVNESLV